MEEIKVDYTPAKIEIIDRENFEKNINAVVTKYKDYIITEDTFSDGKKDRAELNKFIKSLDDNRKEIKKQYNAPLNEFETWFKLAVEPLKKVITKIDDGIKNVENQRREKMKVSVRAELDRLAKEVGLDGRIFEAKYEYLKVANFTDKFEIKKVLQDELEYAVEKELQIQQKYAADKQAITELAFENNTNANPYIRKLDEGVDLAVIINLLTADIKAEKEAQEQRERANAERERKLQEQAQELATKKLEKDFGVGDVAEGLQDGSVKIIAGCNPGENLASATEEYYKQIEEEQKTQQVNSPYPARLTISVDFDDEEQKEFFKSFLNDNGFMWKVKEFVKLGDSNDK